MGKHHRNILHRWRYPFSIDGGISGKIVGVDQLITKTDWEI